MNEDFMVFVVMVTLVSGGLFLVFTKMILNFFRDRRQSKGASLGTGELEAMIRRAVEAGTASLHSRLDDLEQRLEEGSEQDDAPLKALPEAHASILFEENEKPEAPAEVLESRRAGSR